MPTVFTVWHTLMMRSYLIASVRLCGVFEIGIRTTRTISASQAHKRSILFQLCFVNNDMHNVLWMQYKAVSALRTKLILKDVCKAINWFYVHANISCHRYMGTTMRLAHDGNDCNLKNKQNNNVNWQIEKQWEMFCLTFFDQVGKL